MGLDKSTASVVLEGSSVQTNPMKSSRWLLGHTPVKVDQTRDGWRGRSQTWVLRHRVDVSYKGQTERTIRDVLDTIPSEQERATGMKGNSWGVEN